VSDVQAESGRDRYERELGRRRRRLSREVRLRSFTMQSMWIIVLAAGAAVPLATAMGSPGWVGPALGFVVVVATGIERIFTRTTVAAVAVDRLRRRLERERRGLSAGILDAGEADQFALYVRNCEAAIAEFDETMIAYSSKLTRDTE
jgi:hypothetical protein